MLVIAMISILAAASEPLLPPSGSLKNEPTRYCRAVIAGVSRSSDVKVCRTRTEWARWDGCNSATRYCSRQEKVALGLTTAFPLNENSRIVCRIMRGTGSRLSSQKTCMPQREWQRMWDESRSTMSVLQDRHSTSPENYGPR